MSLLLTVLALPAVLLMIVILLGQVGSKQSLNESPGVKEQPFSVLSIEQAFEPDQAIIWETQVPALRLMASAGRKGLPLEDLYPLYLGSRRQYPELYDGSSFESWLEFLRHAELISVDLGTVSLTQEGREFLQFGVTAEAFVAGAPTTMSGDHFGV